MSMVEICTEPTAGSRGYWGEAASLAASLIEPPMVALAEPGRGMASSERGTAHTNLVLSSADPWSRGAGRGARSEAPDPAVRTYTTKVGVRLPGSVLPPGHRTRLRRRPASAPAPCQVSCTSDTATAAPKPTTRASPASRPPCSSDSGIIESVSMTRSAPAAKASTMAPVTPENSWPSP